MPGRPSAGHMTAATVQGILFGLAAGLAPGPLLTLVIAQSLRYGAKEGFKVALAPLVSDLPIIGAALLVATRLGGSRHWLGIMALVGAGYVLWLGIDSLRSGPPVIDGPAPAPRSLGRGTLVNLLNPHPYLFWVTVGTPLMVRQWAVSPLAPVGFVAGFYGLLIGAKLVLAAAAGHSRQWLTGRAYRWANRFMGGLLLIFGLLLLKDAIGLMG